jgi:ATP synthase protein I
VFLGQMIFLLLVIVALKDADWLDGTAFGLTALAVALVWQVFQVIAYVRTRRLAFDAPPQNGQDGGSAA